jgi:hypothetical protein
MHQPDDALKDWTCLRRAFGSSEDPEDQALAVELERFLQAAPVFSRRFAAKHPLSEQTREGQQREQETSRKDEDRAHDTTGPER